MNSLWSFFYVTFWVTPRVFLFSFQEQRKVRKLFYVHAAFASVDGLLKKLYRFQNPYTMCKRFLRAKGASCVDAYGETPVTVFDQMFVRGGLTKSDCFVDLGCGRGRGVFFATSVWGVPAIGVEQIPIFCEKAQRLTRLQPKTQFFCQDICSFSMSLGTFFYFYGLCLEEEDLIKACEALRKIPSQAKLVTVSYPITEYLADFSVISSWEAVFPWGKTQLFLQVRN